MDYLNQQATDAQAETLVSYEWVDGVVGVLMNGDGNLHVFVAEDEAYLVKRNGSVQPCGFPDIGIDNDIWLHCMRMQVGKRCLDCGRPIGWSKEEWEASNK